MAKQTVFNVVFMFWMLKIVTAQEWEPTVAKPSENPAERFQLLLVPESNSIVPHQSLRFTMVLRNSTAEWQEWPEFQIKRADDASAERFPYVIRDANGGRFPFRYGGSGTSSHDPKNKYFPPFATHYFSGNLMAFNEELNTVRPVDLFNKVGLHEFRLVLELPMPQNEPGEPKYRQILESNAVKITVRRPDSVEQKFSEFFRDYNADVDQIEVMRSLIASFENHPLADNVRAMLAGAIGRQRPQEGDKSLTPVEASAAHLTKWREQIVVYKQISPYRWSINESFVSLAKQVPTSEATETGDKSRFKKYRFDVTSAELEAIQDALRERSLHEWRGTHALRLTQAISELGHIRKLINEQDHPLKH